MSRYPPSDYRGPRDRSRSPARFQDRRSSAASIFDNRPSAPNRTASDAPRGPRSQLDGPRAPVAGPSHAFGASSRPGYSSLRDAPPLGTSTAERGRPFRERDYERRDRVPSPRERSPLRNFKDVRDFPPRDFPPRELDIGRARRGSRDGPPSAGSTYSDNTLPFASNGHRGGLGARGRGRADHLEFRGGRPARRAFDDREPLRRERSPPPSRWGRAHSRDVVDRREERKPFDRHDDERRADWNDRDRDMDRTRRDLSASRTEPWPAHEILSGGPPQQTSQSLQINPERLALLEQAGVDLSDRRPPTQTPAAPQHGRPQAPETPSYLNGRAETMANRYNQRGSSPVNAAPAVPAFSFALAPPSAPGNSVSQPPSTRPIPEDKGPKVPRQEHLTETPRTLHEEKHEPREVPSAPRNPPPAPKAQLGEAPLSAPRAPRAHEGDAPANFGSRLHGVRSYEGLSAAETSRQGPNGQRSTSPAPSAAGLPTLIQPVSPKVQSGRFGDLGPPTGPRATRMSPAQISASPKPQFESPRSDAGAFAGLPGVSRGQTPPSGPRNRSFSVSPKVTSSVIPTAPKSSRIAPSAPRGGLNGPGRSQGASLPWAPPSAPRHLQWNQWRRQGPPAVYNDKTIPAKRDFTGEEKERHVEANTFRRQSASGFASSTPVNKLETASRMMPSHGAAPPHDVKDEMDIDKQPLHPSPNPKQPSASNRSAAQSFFGKPSIEGAVEGPTVSDLADELLSSSEEDDHDDQEDLALLNAKYERQKRVLESQIVDLSGREFRATTPLESIARLARVSEKDLQRARRQREHDDTEHRERQSVSDSHLTLPATHASSSDGGPDLLTPKGEVADADVDVDVQSSEEGLQDVKRPRRRSPEVITLPYLLRGNHALFDAEVLLAWPQESEEAKTVVVSAIQQDAYKEADAADVAEGEFAYMLAKWREECEDLDRQKEEEERLERQQSMEAEAGPEPVAPPAPPMNSVAEGRRQHKFASEYEFEKVLRESEETARLEQEKLERENRKNLADMEKEAQVPDQETEETRKRSLFIDTNRLRDPGDLTLVYSYEPPPDTFSENEQQIFIAAFKETPKKWGEIASLLPGKTYKDCIHHYYATKWDGRFRDNRTRKLKAGGRGRGRGGKAPPRGRGAAAMADLNRTEEPVTTSESGRPKRAAAPTTFGEREQDSKAALVGPSPAKKPGNPKQDNVGDNGAEKPGKRRKGPGEKSGRKGKAQQPLAQLAAAPSASPNTPFMQGVHLKEDVPRMQSLEEASLLTGLHTGHQHVLHHDSHMAYAPEPYMPPVPMADEGGRSKQVVQAPSSKSSASSYWSVPEQQDFRKYIAHFGTDFAAIAAHMGTKTQTMIKNHYQRQVDGGDKDNLKDSATRADMRKERGEDIGPPPTPTPIVKRKYDNNQPAAAPAPRALAPHTDPMEIDDAAPAPPHVPSKHVSPPQYQSQPRFPSSAQATPISAHRIVPGPATSAVSPAIPQAQPPVPAPSRTIQHPLGQRIAFLSEARQEPRPGLQATSSFRLGQDGPQRGQQQHQTPVPDAQYMKNLAQEQERAFKVQQQQSQQDRLDSLQRTASYQQGSAQNSPGDPPLQPPPDRRQLIDEHDRGPSPSRFGQSAFSRPPFSQTVLGHLSMGASLAGVPALPGRAAYNPSPPKREELSRPGSVASMQHASSSAPAPVPEPPKRSNLMSILNSEAEDPKPVKRESITSVSARPASPAPTAFSAAPGSTPQQSILPPRRETFGQPSVPQSSFRAAGFPPPSQTSAATSSHRHEGAASATPAAPVKADWAARVLEQRQGASQPSPPAVERDVRPMFSHSHRSSLMGQLNQPMRGNPSPPPHHVIGHSRTPSLTAKSTQPLRESHAAMQREAAQMGAHGHGQPLHPNPYAQQPGASPFVQQPPLPQAQNHGHHAHNGSLGNPFPGMQRGPSREDLIREDALRRDEALRREREEAMRRDEALRREDAMRQEQHQRYIAGQRDREERDVQQQWRMRQELDRRREADFKHREAMAQAQMREDQERHAQAQAQAYGRGPPPQPLHPGAFAAAGFSQSRAPSGFGAREQAMRETEAAMREQERAQQQDMMERRRREDEGRRQEEAFYRHTPIGGYGHPPPPRR